MRNEKEFLKFVVSKNNCAVGLVSLCNFGNLLREKMKERIKMSEWCTRTHTVYKKDAAEGRWICDFRDVNKATIKTPIVIGDSQDIVRDLAKRKWKTKNLISLFLLAGLLLRKNILL